MITVEVNGVNITSKVITGSFDLMKSDDRLQSLGFKTRGLPITSVVGGMEIIVMDDTTLLFGGLIERTSATINGLALDIDVECGGYASLLQRRTIGGTYRDTTAGYIVNDILTNVLASDEITIGLIDAGTTIDEVNYTAQNTNEIITSLAEASGYVWWINEAKQFYFTTSRTYTEFAKEINTDDFTSPDVIKEITNVKLTEDMSEYCNKVFLLGRIDGSNTDITQVSLNANEVTRLGNYYGLGVYGAVFQNNNIKSIEEATTAADVLLQKKSSRPLTLEFKTLEPGLSIENKIKVNSTQLGLTNAYFSITSVSVELYRDYRAKYTVKARNIIEIEGIEVYKGTNDDWVTKLKGLLKTETKLIDPEIIIPTKGSDYTTNKIGAIFYREDLDEEE